MTRIWQIPTDMFLEYPWEIRLISVPKVAPASCLLALPFHTCNEESSLPQCSFLNTCYLTILYFPSFVFEMILYLVQKSNLFFCCILIFRLSLKSHYCHSLRFPQTWTSKSSSFLLFSL